MQEKATCFSFRCSRPSSEKRDTDLEQTNGKTKYKQSFWWFKVSVQHYFILAYTRGKVKGSLCSNLFQCHRLKLLSLLLWEIPRKKAKLSICNVIRCMQNSLLTIIYTWIQHVLFKSITLFSGSTCQFILSIYLQIHCVNLFFHFPLKSTNTALILGSANKKPGLQFYAHFQQPPFWDVKPYRILRFFSFPTE